MPLGFGAKSNNQRHTKLVKQLQSTDAAEKSTWPDYEAQWLKHRLRTGQDKYNVTGLTDELKTSYLDKISADYKEEADTALKNEFVDFLRGNHEVNKTAGYTYPNSEGSPRRIEIIRGREAKFGDLKKDWRVAPWGRKNLHDLDGVTEFLMEKDREAMWQEYSLTFLAEMGPSNL